MKAGTRRVGRWWEYAREPRLLAGVLLIIGSTIAGGWLMAAADDTVAYWSLAHEVHAGDPVRDSDLVAVRVRLDGSAAGAHLRAADPLPADLDDLVWRGDRGAGTLLDAAALESRSAVRSREVPVAVDWGSAPDDLTTGDLVDAWAGPAAGEPAAGRTALVLAGARVIAVGEGNAATGGSLVRTVVLAVAVDDLDASVVAALTAGHVTLVRLP